MVNAGISKAAYPVTKTISNPLTKQSTLSYIEKHIHGTKILAHEIRAR